MASANQTGKQLTPTPWLTSPEYNDQAVLGADGFMVADCSVVSLNEGAPSNQTCQANARLIAAAPELLAALERCYKVFKMDDVDTAISLQCGMAISKAKRSA